MKELFSAWVLGSDYTGNIGDFWPIKSDLTIRLLWEPRDMWVGLYWNRPKLGVLDLYICIIPCLALRITKERVTNAVHKEG